MKASETFERYDGKVRECCNYAVRSSKSFMENADTNKRQPGGKAELLLREQLTSDLKEFCDEVDEVSFYAKQKAYITSNALTFFFLLATAVFAILFTLVNPYFILAALVTALLSLLAALGVFGGTSKSVEDINVFARRKATGAPTSRIIFEANLDAPFKRNISRGTAALLKFLTLLGVLLYIAFCVVMLLVDNGTLNFGFQDELEYAAYVLPIFVIFPLILSRTVSIGSSFPGVADNLLGAYAACGAMRYMAEQDLRLENTELCVLLTSSKEAKNAGAKAFVRDFKADLDALDTTILCFDSIYDPDSLNAVTKGRKVSKLVDDAAANAGVMLTDHNPKYHKGNLKIYDKAGLSAAMISSLPDTPPAFYRGENDDADLLNPNAVHAVEGAIKVALEAAYALDTQDA
ncbi:MAG: hypothetical protein II911_02340 [Clostridia bacterium]|nr:hypothetical protein [Clostridia bacterium]MBQ4459215.1 hypothetical protein [Clostridia bacterium]